MDFTNSTFVASGVPDGVKVIFVADMFVSDYVGGAELTSQALIDASPFKVHCLHSRDVTMDVLRQNVDKFWIFGNFSELNPQLIPSIVGNMRYSILEYDYKFCRARSPEKHHQITGKPCDCHEQMNGKLISAFYYGAMSLWWMSEKQRERYVTTFPFLSKIDNIVLSSVFAPQTLGLIKLLRQQTKTPRKGWIVLGSDSWIKGKSAAESWCKENNKDYEVIWNLPYEQVLEKLASAEGFVYLPEGGDTCPRMVIEAKLLGCQLHLNDNVQHKDEEWFASDDTETTESYLYAAPQLFWNGIKKMMEYKPSVSGYTTTYNCVSQGYPFKQCIESMLGFCNEVCVVDGGSTDDTLKHLFALMGFDVTNDSVVSTMIDLAKQGHGAMSADRRLHVKVIERDWNHPRSAVFDGAQKAEARDMCTRDFCWQMDCDEVVHEDDYKKITELARVMPKDAKIIALPVIEYWGSVDKVRADVNPWKWRLSRNDADITHGIPVELRKHDSDGNLYAAEGTDGCDMISKSTGERLPFINFYTADVDNVRRMAMIGSEEALQRYEAWFNNVVNGLPCVFHYSWYDIARKIKLYRDFWTRHWNSLYGKDTADTAENNMMFDVPWSQVTDEMIASRAVELGQKLGGWVWHRKWDGSTVTPYIKSNRTQPSGMFRA